MRHYVSVFSRFFVGGVFIFSGLIKLNDPVGTAIKMEEYFEVFSVDFGEFFRTLVGSAMSIGFVLIVLEILLGIAVLLYYRMHITTVVLLGLVFFFAFLTFYSAYFNKVTDCGCFGDAIILTPWQSFCKDLILLVFVLHLFWYRKDYMPVLPPLKEHAVMGGALLFSIFLGVYAVQHLPFIDFRAYGVGLNISEQMIPEEQPIIEYAFKKDGEVVTSTQFLSEKEGYVYLSSKVLNEDKVIPKISDYSVMDRDGNDITRDTFQGVKFLIIIYDVEKAAEQNIDALRTLIQELQGKVDCLMLTASTPEQVEVFRHKNQIAVPYYYTDATVLKTIVRSNPGTTLWKDSNVLGKWHYRDTPTAKEIYPLL